MKNKLLLLIMLALPAVGYCQADSLAQAKPTPRVIIKTVTMTKEEEEAKKDSLFLKFIKVNFAVPDLPAFNILGNSPSDILRPTDVKALSILTSEFYNGSSIIVPKSFAMELSPFLLAKSNSITLHDYQKNKLLYNLRISLGTKTTTSNNQKYSNLAIGARITLLDKGDLKTDEEYLNILYKENAFNVDIDKELQDEFLAKENKLLIDVVSNPALDAKRKKYIADNRVEKIAKVNTLKNLFYTSDIKEMAKFKEKYKNENWNKEKIEFAYAYLGSSPDSLIKNIQSKKHSAWLTGAFPVGRWGQLLGGLNYSYIYADSLNKEKTVNYEYNTFSISSRLYFGTNRIKGFVEGQYKSISLNSKKDAFVNAGGEFNLRDGIWLVVNAGVNWHDLGSSNSKSGFYSSLNLRFTLPENFKLN